MAQLLGRCLGFPRDGVVDLDLNAQARSSLDNDTELFCVHEFIIAIIFSLSEKKDRSQHSYMSEVSQISYFEIRPFPSCHVFTVTHHWSSNSNP